MTVNGSNAGHIDERLTEVLLKVLAKEDDKASSGGSAKRRKNSSSVGHDAYGDSSLSDIFYSAPVGENEVHCRSCGAVCPRSNKYCGYCAAYLGNAGDKHEFEEIDVQPIDLDISLIQINEDSTDGARIPLKYNETIIGRSGDSRFPTDAYLSPRQARLIVKDRSLYIEDLDSLNGSYIRVRGEVMLHPGDVFLAGRQLLRFERFEQVVSSKARSSDGTRYMGSPPTNGDFKLVQIGIGNITQNVYCLSPEGANFGREQGDIIFNKDRFMSGRHAQIFPREDGNYYLLDMNSSNGTWMKINGRCSLYHGDLIFLGQQLFRVESPDIA